MKLKRKNLLVFMLLLSLVASIIASPVLSTDTHAAGDSQIIFQLNGASDNYNHMDNELFLFISNKQICINSLDLKSSGKLDLMKTNMLGQTVEKYLSDVEQKDGLYLQYFIEETDNSKYYSVNEIVNSLGDCLNKANGENVVFTAVWKGEEEPTTPDETSEEPTTNNVIIDYGEYLDEELVTELDLANYISDGKYIFDVEYIDNHPELFVAPHMIMPDIEDAIYEKHGIEFDYYSLDGGDNTQYDATAVHDYVKNLNENNAISGDIIFTAVWKSEEEPTLTVDFGFEDPEGVITGYFWNDRYLYPRHGVLEIKAPEFSGTYYSQVFSMIEGIVSQIEAVATDERAIEGYIIVENYDDIVISEDEIRTVFSKTRGINQSSTIIVKWDIPADEEFIVSFDMNGHGDQVEAQTVAKDQQASIPDDPTAEGFRFIGWFADAEGTEEFDFTAPITEDTTIYALWDTPPFTITFNLNGHGSNFGIDVKHGETLPESEIPDDPTADGFTFMGWYKDEEGTEEFDFTTPVTDHVVAYAIWKANDVKVTFDMNGHGDPVEVNVKYGEAIAEEDKPADPEAEGFTFQGWYQDAEGTTEFDFATEITEETTIYAKWKANDVKVTFDMNGHGDPVEVNVKYGEAIADEDKPADPEAEGFTFQGWYQDAEGTNEFDFITAITEETTIYAKWEKVETPVDPMDLIIKDDYDGDNSGITVELTEEFYKENTIDDKEIVLEATKETVAIELDIKSGKLSLINKFKLELFTVDKNKNKEKIDNFNDQLTARIPLDPSLIDGKKLADGNNFYYLDSASPKIWSYTIEGNNLVFKTNHFSEWGIGKAVSTPGGNNGSKPGSGSTGSTGKTGSTGSTGGTSTTIKDGVTRPVANGNIFTRIFGKNAGNDLSPKAQSTKVVKIGQGNTKLPVAQGKSPVGKQQIDGALGQQAQVNNSTNLSQVTRLPKTGQGTDSAQFGVISLLLAAAVVVIKKNLNGHK